MPRAVVLHFLHTEALEPSMTGQMQQRTIHRVPSVVDYCYLWPKYSLWQEEHSFLQQYSSIVAISFSQELYFEEGLDMRKHCWCQKIRQ